ncbi:MAG: hypothetical protein CV087_08170 [Candidatus Brocadia sp. WS118]|nr:MAG: hypothetical protein CV087_08170 [Candidatus Brocadia sp. WS118]
MTNSSTLADYKNGHAGETIIVCGCGASLNEFKNPQDFITIGVNDVGRLFTPDYLVVLNPPQQFKGDRFQYVRNSKARAIFTQLDLKLKHPNVVRIKLGKRGGTDFSDPTVLHYTQNSPYVALCLAAHLGAKRIGLIGVDFTDHHFFAKTGRHHLTRQLSRIDGEYNALGRALEQLGIEVVNLSRESRLTAFRKGSIEELAVNRHYDRVPAKENIIRSEELIWEGNIKPPRIFFVNYKFLSCGDVFRTGLKNAAADLNLEVAEAYWNDPQLPAKVKRFHPDLLFVVHGRKFVKKWNGQFQQYHRSVWLLDEPYEVDDTAKFSRQFDTVFVNDPNTIHRHQNAHYLPVGFDPHVYFETEDERVYDVGFIGGYNSVREKLLTGLLKKKLLSYIVGGPWRNEALRSICLSPNIPASETAALYQKTKIVINIFRERHHFNRQNISAYSLNPRIYEALACGSLVVSEYRPEIKELFPELPVFGEEDELLKIVDDLLRHPDKFEETRQACQKHLSAQRYQDRLKRVVEICLNTQLEKSTPHPISADCGITDTKELIQIQEESMANIEKSVPEPVDIVMLTYNRLKYLQQTVDALFESTEYPFRLTIVDNNSEPDVRHYLEAHEDKFHQVIFNEKNEYVPAFHRGIEKTTSEIFVATEPDIVVPKLSPCWLTQYMEIFQENPKLGLLGIRLDRKDHSPLTPHWSGGIDNAPVYNRRVLLGNVGVWMMALRRKAYPGAFPSDNGICAAVRKKQYEVGYTKDIIARHLGWYEYRDYPEYLLEKSKRPHSCFPYYAEAKLVDEKKLNIRKRPTIILTTFNGRLEWLKDLLISIQAYTPQPFSMIVVDNGTTDGTQNYLKDLDWVTTIRNEKNLDDTKGVNQALKQAETDYIVKLDTDTLLAGAGWWEEVYQYMEAHPNVAIAGDVWNPGFSLKSRLYKKGWNPEEYGKDHWAHVQGGFMVLRRKALEQIGHFNEDYPHEGMDVEISFRALSYGWDLGSLSFVSSKIIHEANFSSSFKIYHPVRNSSLRRTIIGRIQNSTVLNNSVNGNIQFGKNGDCLQHLKQGAQCEINNGYIFITGQGWDNCLVSKLSYQNLVFKVDIKDLRGSAILKIRMQDPGNPASNSYHIILGEWGNYIAKENHVFQRFKRPRGKLIPLQIGARDNQVEVRIGGIMVAQFYDDALKEGHVYLGIKDGQAKFVNPHILVY